ncbi:sigma-70 family RNA polymerase sigma factor [Paralimibaculum aggregatum]|uniref:Sigma-70 family RNA polymerase sigma factor n=1 Tax=Paralimibaculum aggregatum TaxID=3036245 RepID=A0ABQ6LU78_9RHOB|nr:sigma-70 family RNA polymerase sigma factor [Limibaculum sp. NKW23]GMG85640.1 sigma-70 family RNA polymerase sigma factor [Limibaculum sp. NKW23]
MTDAAIDLSSDLEACARGDRAALRRIFEAEGGRLAGVALRILRRRELAEEAVQEAFVKIWRSAGQYDPARGSARGWIYAVLRNHALNMLRDGSRETATEPGALDALRDDEAMLSAAWERLDEASALKRCLAALDTAKRQAVLMAYVLGYTHGEIAGRVGAPLGTAKAWVRRGLAALRACLS